MCINCRKKKTKNGHTCRQRCGKVLCWTIFVLLFIYLNVCALCCFGLYATLLIFPSAVFLSFNDKRQHCISNYSTFSSQSPLMWAARPIIFCPIYSPVLLPPYRHLTDFSVSLSRPSRFMYVLSLSMTRRKMTSSRARRRGFASGWATSFRSSPRTTTTGGRESWRTPRTAPRASSPHLSCRSGEWNA